ncbi:unnamed protein product [Vitrella brassicaformis CCMP3155]|uniref:Uncharacterized protein n=2 Tax=Vitrella brassicaformis TaxID=1169539 RepID=A0A0G4EXQ5_VITBC|nr:unnamed protein product [Vitrella brassicaformis CCMP3155]|mmetsp:Transcript_52836/g.132827  ORF Transcript_52836/g.132827 Transcript_52836/m.132827 type:complete len:166 (+) Transcript_52836:276-773(+)|eukprot:CEM03501.1 unnamed protein product [Vitrella brassicaformis CCMP3155]
MGGSGSHPQQETATHPQETAIPAGRAVRINLEDIRYFKFEHSPYVQRLLVTSWLETDRFKTVKDVQAFIDWMGEPGREAPVPSENYSVLVGCYEGVDGDTPVGDKGKSEDDPFILRKVKIQPGGDGGAQQTSVNMRSHDGCHYLPVQSDNDKHQIELAAREQGVQ